MTFWEKFTYRVIRLRLWWDSIVRINTWQIEAMDKILAIEESQNEILRDLPQIIKLAEVIESKELTRSEFVLNQLERSVDDELTLDEIDEAIQNQRSLKLGLEGSPAIGSREIRGKNMELIAVNNELTRLIHLRRKVAPNGSDTNS